MSQWSVYMVECADGTLYTGISDDVESRLRMHNSNKGARYTKGRTPVVLRYTEYVGDRGEAQKIEYRLKKLPRLEKMKLWI